MGNLMGRAIDAACAIASATCACAYASPGAITMLHDDDIGDEEPPDLHSCAHGGCCNNQVGCASSSRTSHCCGSHTAEDATTPTSAVAAAEHGWVGGYRKLHILGRGRFGKVRLCERADGELFALKTFRKPALARQRQWDADAGVFRTALENVQTEIDIMRRLRHPNIVRLHDVIDDLSRDKLHIVIDYVPGGPVVSPAHSGGGVWTPLCELTARGVLRDVLCGLAYLHANGVIHQDLKPDNVLRAADGRALIADFGVARMLLPPTRAERCEPAVGIAGAAAARAMPRILLESSDGTPAFRAPETYGEGMHCGMAADIWSLGVTLYVMLFGLLPFPRSLAATTRSYAMAHTEGTAWAHDAAVIEDAICNQPLHFPELPTEVLAKDSGLGTEPTPVSQLALELLTAILVKSPSTRPSLQSIASHPWVTSCAAEPLNLTF